MTNKISCGGSTCHGHGDYAVCGKPYIGGIYYCHKCQLKELEHKCSKLYTALKRVATWDELDVKYCIDYGSNGQRDYYRNVATQALTEYEDKQ